MANVCDYVKWRGDLNLEQSEFNEIDNLILSRFSYFPFDNIIKKDEVVTIKELGERFKKQDVSKLPILWKDDVDLFPLMGDSKRFGEMLATKYVNKIAIPAAIGSTTPLKKPYKNALNLEIPSSFKGIEIIAPSGKFWIAIPIAKASIASLLIELFIKPATITPTAKPSGILWIVTASIIFNLFDSLLFFKPSSCLSICI